MLDHLEPAPTYRTSTGFLEKAVLVLFGNAKFAVKSEAVVPALKQAVDTFLSLGLRDFLFYYHRVIRPDDIRALFFKTLFDMKKQGANLNIWYAYSERGDHSPQMISHFSGISGFPEHAEEVTFLPVPDSSMEERLHEALFQSAAGVICTYTLKKMSNGLGSNIARKKNVPLINVYLNTLLKTWTKADNPFPEYKAMLSIINKLTQPKRRQYSESERLTQRALLVGGLDRLVGTMERQKEKEILFLKQQIAELEKLLQTYRNV